LGGSYFAQNLRRNVSRRISISPWDVGNKVPPRAFNEDATNHEAPEWLQGVQSDVLMCGI